MHLSKNQRDDSCQQDTLLVIQGPGVLSVCFSAIP